MESNINDKQNKKKRRGIAIAGGTVVAIALIFLGLWRFTEILPMNYYTWRFAVNTSENSDESNETNNSLENNHSDDVSADTNANTGSNANPGIGGRAFVPPEDNAPKSMELPALRSFVVNGVTDYSLTADISGIWLFTTMDSENCDPILYLYDSSGETVAYDDDSAGGTDAILLAILEKGESYTLNAGFYGTGTGSYTMLVTSPVEVREDEKQIQVSIEGTYTLTTFDSGTWEFQTKSSGVNDPQIYILDSSSEILAMDDDSAGGNDAIVLVELEANELYFIYVGFHNDDGQTTLSITKQR